MKRHHSKNFHKNLTECEQTQYSYLHRLLLALIFALFSLLALSVKGQCYPDPTEHGLIVRASYSFGYGNNFIGNNAAVGYSIGSIGVLAGYHEFRRGQDTARQSLGITIIHDLNRGKIVGSLFLTHGTRKFTEFGVQARLTGQTPLYLSISTLSVQIGLLVKF